MNILNVTLVVSLFTICGVALAEPRTLIRKQQPVVAPAVVENKCVVNPLTWDIPLGTNQLTISYLNSRNRVIFERDFSVDGGNKIRLRARKDNEN